MIKKRFDAVRRNDMSAFCKEADCEWSVGGRADVFTDEAQANQIFVVDEIKRSTKKLWRECRQDGSRSDWSGHIDNVC